MMSAVRVESCAKRLGKLFAFALARSFVRAPAKKLRPVLKTTAAHMVEVDLNDELRPNRLPLTRSCT
jgi:hypothetical protein